MTLRLSWSALRVQEECREAGYHRRAGRGLKQDNQRVFFPGTVLDRVVRDWLTDGPEKDTMPDMVTSVVDREWKNILDEGGSIAWKDARDKAKVIADVREACVKIQPDLMRWVVPFEYQADLKFRAPVMLPHPAGGLEQVEIIGAMDITVRDDKNRFMVHDVKMTRDNSYWRKVRGQLTYYDLAMFLMEGKYTSMATLMQPLCNEPMKMFRITDEERTQMMARVTAFARQIWMNDHTPRQDTTYCGYCFARSACSKFAPVTQPGGRRVVELF